MLSPASVSRMLRLAPRPRPRRGRRLIALSYEIFFFRTVSFVSGSSAEAFALTLAAFLIGLASGARQAENDNLRCRCRTRHVMRRAIADLIRASVVGLLFLPLLDHVGWLGGGVVVVAFVLVYLIARFWGSLLPHLAELAVTADGEAGGQTALLYLANILGSAAGSIVTGFFLADHLGLLAMGTALVGASLAYTALLTLMLPLRRAEKILRVSAAAALGLLAMAAIPRWSMDVLENLQKGAPPAGPFVHVVENRSGIITVAANGAVYGNGMYDGRFNTGLTHDTNGIVRPYALSLFHPAPRDVLMIGLSSGSWAQVIANNPEVATLTAVEINPGYASLIAEEPEVASLLTNPKVTIVTDDGRRWLRANPERRFDAIVSNTTWRFRANVTNLLSAEFLLGLIKSTTSSRAVFSSTTPPSPSACSARPAWRFPTGRASSITWWSRSSLSNGILPAGAAPSRLTGSMPGRCSTPR